MSPFHLALPVKELLAAETFYRETLQCTIGRRDERWIDFNFFGHQLTVHLSDSDASGSGYNLVDGHAVPARHFGVILEWDRWEQLVARLEALEITFYIRPTVRFAGKVGEQGTFFIQDPSDNFLEFKTFRDFSQIFAAN